ncbi:MAG: hypothetical protein JSS34_03675 [Proteobacteria bacterium]|nr:hypothetical protein [Pseudomonadota bacterium]
MHFILKFLCFLFLLGNAPLFGLEPEKLSFLDEKEELSFLRSQTPCKFRNEDLFFSEDEEFHPIFETEELSFIGGKENLSFLRLQTPCKFRNEDLFFSNDEEDHPILASPIVDDKSFELIDIDSAQKNLKIGLWLNRTPQVYLHFFWTAGHRPHMLSKDHPKKRILIGGEKYRSIFFSRVDLFLSQTPQKVSVVMTCDPWTYSSNEEKFRALQSQFNDRFSVQFVEEVVKTLKREHFAYHKMLETIFNNACFGNPVIASDVYRLLLNTLHKDAPDGSILAYSDEDRFCEEMNCSEDWEEREYFRDLFDGMSVGCSSGGNDFIKFIKGPEGKEKSRVILQKLKAHFEKKPVTIVHHFPILFRISEEFEKAEISKYRDMVWQFYLGYVQEHHFYAREVIQETGPGFVLESCEREVPQTFGKCRVINGLSWYDKESCLPDNFILWFTPNSILREEVRELEKNPMVSNNTSNELQQEGRPFLILLEEDILSWKGFVPIDPKVYNAEVRMEEVLGEELKSLKSKISERYAVLRSLFSDLDFLKKLGNHPFYLHLETFLRNDALDFCQQLCFPELVCLYYRYDQNLSENERLSKEEWAKAMFYQTQADHFGIFYHIKRVFKTIGVDIKVSAEEIQDMIKDL